VKTHAKAENQFAAILQARTATGAEPAATSPAHPKAVAPATAATAPTAPAQRTGRPAGKGKSSDPAFRQVTAYIPRELHDHATIALRLANQVRIDADKEDFSDLLTRLLADWYQTQTFYRPGR
jgi:hypothetical protein